MGGATFVKARLGTAGPGVHDLARPPHAPGRIAEHLNAHVLPVILDPYNRTEVVIELDRSAVLELTGGHPASGPTT